MPNFTFEDREVIAEDGDTVLGALLRAGIGVDYSCKAGACQSCLLRTCATVPSAGQAGVDETLAGVGAFLSCQVPAGSVDAVERLSPDLIPSYEGVLVDKQFLAHDVMLVTLRANGFTAVPGKFVRLDHASGLQRPYSLAGRASEPEDLVKLHVRILPDGAMSRVLLDSEIGARFRIEGPFGKCVYQSSTGDEPILMIGSGTGLGSLYAIATAAIAAGHRGPIFLYHGASSPDRLYFSAELAELAGSHPNFHYCQCVDEGAAGSLRAGSPLAAALTEHSNLEGYKAYLCGHPALVIAAQKKCFLAGANLRDICADRFEPA